MAALLDLGRVALDVVLAVGPMVSSEHVAQTQHTVQMRHSRLESYREDVRDMLDERLDSSQNLTLKSTLLFGFCTAILVEGFPPQKMKSELCVDLFLFLVPWGICLLFQSMTFAVLYQRGMMTVGLGMLRRLQRITSKQAEEEIEQGPQTFIDRFKSRGHIKDGRWVLRSLWGVVARLFALPPSGHFKPSYTPCASDEEEDFCSVGHDVSELSLDYLTVELQAAGVKEEDRQAHLVQVTEMSKLPEVKALELYEEQAQNTVVSGSLFTLLSLCFCIIYHLEMRSEVYQERPLVLLARFGIFLPPLLVAAFTSFIQPVPPDYQLILNSADSRNPRHTRPAAQCVVAFCALASTLSLGVAMQLHMPQPPEVTLTEWPVDRWPLFFNPTGIAAVEDSLLITTDFALARFELGDSQARLVREHRLPGIELGDATVLNSSVHLAGHELYHFRDNEAVAGPRLPQLLDHGLMRGSAYWPRGDLLFLTPSTGVVAARILHNSLSVDFRLAVTEAVLGLTVAHELLYVLLERELLVVDLDRRPGEVLRRLGLPQRATGVASMGHQLFLVTSSPAKLFTLQLPLLRQCSLRSCSGAS